jgi:hypothetical protein
MNQDQQPTRDKIFSTAIMAVFMTTIILGSTVAIGYMLQPVAAQPIIPPSCPPNTQDFDQGLCIGPEPTLTYLCDTDPAGLQLVGGELGPQCVLIDDEGNILYSEPAILVDAECNGPFSFIEETLQCATRPGGQNIAP